MTCPPLDLHPANPRYFRFRGLPTFLLTSAEHYGAVVNLDFDYVPYLGELQRCRFNYTRIFSGTYLEREESLTGTSWANTLAPRPGRVLTPWARSDVEGYEYGGTKFDLDTWDAAYFTRLRDFLAQASLRGIIVELCLFSAIYSASQWTVSPMNARNNINGVGAVPFDRAYHVDNDGLLPYQVAVARKLAAEVSEFDNVFLEICNEPYFGHLDDGWAREIIAGLEKEFARLGSRQLIAWNVANNTAQADDMDPAISILNFHYANPPDAVATNHDLAKPVVYDESGFKGIERDVYRQHAWEFMLAGGAGFNHLDYSFAPSGHERGTLVLNDMIPGGGDRGLRDQLTALRDFLWSLPFLHMKVGIEFIATSLSANIRCSGFSQAGRAYAAYLLGELPTMIDVSIPAGTCELAWLDPVAGTMIGQPVRIEATGPPVALPVPSGLAELAFSLRRVDAAAAGKDGNFDFAAAATT